MFTEVVDRHAQACDHCQAGKPGWDSPANRRFAGGEVSYGESADSADEEATDVSGVINGRNKIGDEPDEQNPAQHARSQGGMAFFDRVDEHQSYQAGQGAGAAHRHVSDEFHGRRPEPGDSLLSQQDGYRLWDGGRLLGQCRPGVAGDASAESAKHVDREKLGFRKPGFAEATEVEQYHAVHCHVEDIAMEKGTGDEPPVISGVNAAAVNGAQVQHDPPGTESELSLRDALEGEKPDVDEDQEGGDRVEIGEGVSVHVQVPRFL